MIRRVADRIAPVVDEVVVNCRDDQREPIAAAMEGFEMPLSFAIDEEPDQGPMAGMATGLAAVDAEYAAVVACDMPFVEPDLLAYLFERAAGHEAAVPRPDEWFQTTQAVYRAESMAGACQDAIAAGERRVVEPLFDLDYVVVEREEIEAHASLETFENINTREAFAAAQDRFE